ncbi:FRG domain-containing protein [Burkholderia gladioli]|uniref:FRG domain-containing protein n=1 Tax=Burkholderia gladioli TaxID=28095 RepID=UPI001641A202|nr:FRG domain-containing protein [Burkholderia gladioli]
MPQREISYDRLVGQWRGRFQADDWHGDIVIDLEHRSGKTVGSAMMFSAPGINASTIVGKINDVFYDGKFAYAVATLRPTHPRYPLQLVEPPQFREAFGEAKIAQLAQVKFTWNLANMEIIWSSDLGKHGVAQLIRDDPLRPSQIPAETMSWDAFKRIASKLKPREFIFRGQKEPWRLRSHFHRSNRSDLLRYTFDDMDTLMRHLSAYTKHVHNKSDHDQTGALLHLAQHHGFPTPLIDWSYSPYVAAFFAFRGMSIKASRVRHISPIRIFKFDQKSWREDFPQFPFTAPMRPHFSLMEFSAHENTRAVPQQALSALTNVDDVESYIQQTEEIHKKQYITAIDIPAKERGKAMSDLAMMGITAGSLFPGLDGACEELRERLFEI